MARAACTASPVAALWRARAGSPRTPAPAAARIARARARRASADALARRPSSVCSPRRSPSPRRRGRRARSPARAGSRPRPPPQQHLVGRDRRARAQRGRADLRVVVVRAGGRRRARSRCGPRRAKSSSARSTTSREGWKRMSAGMRRARPSAASRSMAPTHLGVVAAVERGEQRLQRRRGRAAGRSRARRMRALAQGGAEEVEVVALAAPTPSAIHTTHRRGRRHREHDVAAVLPDLGEDEQRRHRLSAALPDARR